MPISSIKDLIDAGVHFGHRASRWNPKMAPFIHSKQNLIHIINLKETLKGLVRSRHFLKSLVANGGRILFVGTKRQAKAIIDKVAADSGMPGVSERWLGGTLTNYTTIRSRLNRLNEIEGMEKTGEIERYSKKMISAIMREKRKLLRNLEGIRTLNRLPAAMVIVDPHHEDIAVKEARKLKIPVVALIDTDSDPEIVDLPIPCNDDAMRSIQVLLTELAAAVKDGAVQYAGSAAERAMKEASAPRQAPPEGAGFPGRDRRGDRGERRRPRRGPGGPGGPGGQGGGRGPGGGHGPGRGPGGGGGRGPRRGPGGPGESRGPRRDEGARPAPPKGPAAPQTPPAAGEKPAPAPKPEPEKPAEPKQE